MSHSLPIRKRWLPVSGAVLLTLLTLVACGDSDSGDDGAGSGRSSSGTSEKAQAREAVEQLYAAMGDGDAAGVCEQLSKAGQRQIAKGGLGEKAPTCAKSFQGFLDAAERAGGLDMVLRAKVAGVKLNGDKGTAKVTFGKGSAGDVPLVKENGEWRLAAVGASP